MRQPPLIMADQVIQINFPTWNNWKKKKKRQQRAKEMVNYEDSPWKRTDFRKVSQLFEFLFFGTFINFRENG